MISILLAVIFCSVGAYILAWNLAKLDCEAQKKPVAGYGSQPYRGYE
jgi:hypothetical protein